MIAHLRMAMNKVDYAKKLINENNFSIDPEILIKSNKNELEKTEKDNKDIYMEIVPNEQPLDFFVTKGPLTIKKINWDVIIQICFNIFTILSFI